ncbi:MAG: serine hydrolase [Oligoflexia bacterium]|nr:serine hydrolase [Oligoflexia bacterium]
MFKFIFNLLVLFLSLSSMANFQDALVTENKELKELKNFVFGESNIHSSNALLIIKDGKVIVEEYKNGFHKEKPHRIWSISKSFSSALMGMAIDQKILTLDEKVHDTYPLTKEKGYYKELTIKHLMQMSSGFEWSEGYENNPLKSNVIDMLFINNYRDMATYTSQRPFAHRPGKQFNYSSGETNLMMGILRKKLGAKYENYPWEQLFQPLGMKNITWERDQAGTYVGSSYLYMSARDLAKFGQLYLQKGKWNDKQLLKESFVDESVKLVPAFEKTILKGEDNAQGYGYQWWLNKDLPIKKLKRPYPALAESAYFGLGHHGQTLIVIPEFNAVVVRYGSDKQGAFDRKIFTDKLAPFFKSLQ